MLALPIFPVRLQTSIFGASELNFRVRNGNGWTLILINTNLLSCEQESKQRKLYLRATHALVQKKPYIYEKRFRANSLCYTISLLSTSFLKKFGDPWENRTPVCGVRGRRLSRLTNGP